MPNFDVTEAELARIIDHAGDLKRELVAFALSDRFRPALNGFMTTLGDIDGANEAVMTMMIDTFALQHTLPHGGRVIDHFARERRPALSSSDRQMLRGWTGVVQGVFEVHHSGTRLMARNLLDDLDYDIHATAGPDVLADIAPGMFLIGRIVPLGHGTGAWILSGHPIGYPADSAAAIAAAALDQLAGNPEVMRANPALVERSRRAQDHQHAAFVEMFGGEVIVGTPAEMRGAVHAFHRALGDASGGAGTQRIPNSPRVEVVFPEALMEETSVGVIFDADDGLGFYGRFGEVDSYVAFPTDPHAHVLRAYLEDDTVEPSVIRRLAWRHPESASEAFRRALGRKRFSWERDGERMLRKFKWTDAETDPLPRVSMIGTRLSELLSADR